MGDLLRRRALMVVPGGGPTPSINDYVQDGIQWWLDGIENTRSGHNASATKWEDLAANHRDYTYNASSTIGDKYCIPNGQMNSVNSRPGTSSDWTFEIVAEWVDTGGGHMILPWKGNAYGTVFIRYNSGDPQMCFSAGNSNGTKGVSMLKTGIHTYTARGIDSMAVDGTAQAIQTSSGSWKDSYNRVGYYNSSYPTICYSKIYAVRIYNRLLTDAEVTLNRSIDAARFGGS